MPFDTNRIISGDMPEELAAGVDRMIEEFIDIVDTMVESRHLQKGIARIQLPSSMIFILDKEQLYVLGQLRTENRSYSYFYRPDRSLTPQQAANSAQWEFGFEDPFHIRFPADLLDKKSEERLAALQEIASAHIDSEFLRLNQLLSFVRTRPIFGQVGQPVGAGITLLLLPREEELRGNETAIKKALEANGLAGEEADDIREGRSAVHQLWYSINSSAFVIADLTGADPAVMYGLGIAHTLGKDTILIHPQGSKYLTDIPKTYSIVYEDSTQGRASLSEQLGELLGSIVTLV